MISVNSVNKFIFSRREVYELFANSANPFTNFFEAPVFPANETPEVDSPYTIYTWRTGNRFPEWMLREDTITYSIWDHDIGRLQDYESILRKYLGDLDHSAEAFRLWSTRTHYHVPVMMYEMRFLGSTDVFPQDEVGGVVGKNLTFKTTYIECEPMLPIGTERVGNLDIS